MMEEEKRLTLLEHYFLEGVCEGQEKKFIRLQHYYLDVVYDGGRQKTQSFITLFLLWCL